MSFQTIILSQLAISNFLYPVYLKKIADQPSKSWQQFWMYLFCLILSAIFVIFNKFSFTTKLLPIFILGIINSFAVYCNFRAVNVSLSKTSVLRPMSNAMAMILGYVFLNEVKFLNINILLGILLCFASILFFILKNKNEINISTENKLFIRWVFGFTTIFALASFFMRYFALEGIALAEFLLSWYAGAFIGSAALLLPARKKEIFNRLSKKNNMEIFLLAFFIWLAFLLSYRASEIAPITITEPIFLISGMISPMLIGLFIFKEANKLSIKEYVGLISGVAGAIVIFSGY